MLAVAIESSSLGMELIECLISLNTDALYRQRNESDLAKFLKIRFVLRVPKVAMEPRLGDCRNPYGV